VGSAASLFCFVLLTVTILLWILFFALDNKVRDRKVRANADREKNWQALVLLSTLAGTILAIYTLMGIFFFADIAPRVH
jgi:amino acid transporter